MSLVDESVRTGVPSEIRHPLIDCRLDLLDRLLSGLLPRELRLELVRGAEQEILARLAESDIRSPTDQQVLAVLRNCEPPEAILAAVMAENGASTLGNHSRESSAAICLMATRRPLLKTAKMSGAFGAASLVLLFAVPWVYLFAMVGASTFDETLSFVIFGTYLVLLSLTGLAATGTGLSALWQLRRRGGTHTGYGIATAGILVGCIPLLIAGLAGVLIASQLLGTGLIAGAGRTRQLIYTSENFSEISDQWDQAWSLDNPESAGNSLASPAYGPEHGLEAVDSK